MQILKDSTLIADAATGVEHIYSENRYKASFLPSALSVFNDNYTVINCMCACVRTSAEDNFPREGGGCVYLMISLNLRIFMFGFVRENIYSR